MDCPSMMVFQKWNRNGLPFKAKLQCIGLHLRHICLTSIVLQRPRVEFGQGNIRRHQETSVSTGAKHATKPWCHGGAEDRMGQLLWSAGNAVICWAFLSDWPLEHTRTYWNCWEHWIGWFSGLHCNTIRATKPQAWSDVSRENRQSHS